MNQIPFKIDERKKKNIKRFVKMETISNQTCVIEFFSPNPWTIVLNVIRVSVAFLYLFWLILVILMKNLQRRGMVYLYNLAFNGLFYASIGLYYSTWSSCDQLSLSICYLSTFFTTYTAYYSGYALAALILHRLLCITHSKWTSNLSNLTIAITIALVWIIPTLCALIEMFAFSKSISYKPKAQVCSNEYYSFYAIISFFGVSGIFIPSAVIVSAYLTSVFQLRRLAKKTSNRRKIEPPRITIQIVVYIVLYIITCLTNLLASFPLNFPGEIVPLKYLGLFFNSVRLLKWVHHICPLGLMYFNADLLREYKKLFSRICGKQIQGI